MNHDNFTTETDTLKHSGVSGLSSRDGQISSMAHMAIVQRRNNFIRAFATDYFAVIAVYFPEGRVELIQVSQEIVPQLAEEFAGFRPYSAFLEFYCTHYIQGKDREEFLRALSPEMILSRLSEQSLYIARCHHLYREISCPTEVRVTDVSEKQDRSICCVAFRLMEDVMRQTNAMNKRNDMVWALARDYTSVCHIDINQDRFSVLRANRATNPKLYEYANQELPYSEIVRRYAQEVVQEEDRQTVLRMAARTYLQERLEREDSYSFRIRLNHERGEKFYEVRFVRTEHERAGCYAILALRDVDQEMREELQTRLEVERANRELKKALEKEQLYQAELKNAIEAARLASQAKTDFLSRMSHDIRTPMNAIIGMTAIAATHLNDAEKIRDCLGKISASSRHLLGIINDILDMSKIESGKMELKEEAFNLSELITELFSLLDPQIRAKGHQLKAYIHHLDHEDVVGDYTRIQQAFVNILSNAVKYTPEGGCITVSVRELESHSTKTGHYEFIFEDNGIGMSQAVLDKIFQPFIRGEDDRVNKIQGTGLGMPITKNIIQMMGGSIHVESAPGQGSKFTVMLTLLLQESKAQDVTGLAGLPVLIADDDRSSCEITCAMLQEIGMEGEWVLSGKEAVTRAAARHEQEDDFFAVILDWKMPEMDGVETAHQIRAIVGDSVPIIILSAYDWSDVETEALKAGVSAFITKPIFKSTLIHTFQTLQNPKREGEMEGEGLSMLGELDLSSKRILLVEDNELNREIATEIISPTGVSIEQAEDGQKAVEKVKNAPPGYYDMILMDVRMPIMDGYEATRAIRALHGTEYQTIPIIAMTANTFEEDVQEALNAGMNEHVAKPIDLKQLFNVMCRWLR